MPGNSLGERFTVTLFGESHGACVGAVLDGCPAGLPVAEEEIQRELDLRRPGQSLVSSLRREPDRLELLAGIFNGHTTGAPILLLIRNVDVRPSPYEQIKDMPRPSHADYFARVKYGGFNDWRGGGRFSGRLTAPLVAAGAIAKKLLARLFGVEILAYSLEIAGIRAASLDIETIRSLRYSNEVRCPDERAARLMYEKILEARKEGDSVGGIVECIALNVPIALGEPFFGALDAELSGALMAIPAAKGVEFGRGFEAARLRGSEHNDQFGIVEGRVIPLTNNAGGIVGGLSTGLPIVFRVAFKPPASIAKPQRTVDLSKMEEVELVVPGRHDPCVVPRAVPVVEAVTALVLADHAARAGLVPPVIKE
jgi:chorismate synthase